MSDRTTIIQVPSYKAQRVVTLTKIGDFGVFDIFKPKVNLKKKKPSKVVFGKNLTLEVLSKLYGELFDAVDKLTADHTKLPVEEFKPFNNPSTFNEIYKETTFAKKIKNINKKIEEGEKQGAAQAMVLDFDKTLRESSPSQEELERNTINFVFLQRHCKENNIILVLATGQTQEGFQEILNNYELTLEGVDVIADGTASRYCVNIGNGKWQEISDYRNTDNNKNFVIQTIDGCIQTLFQNAKKADENRGEPVLYQDYGSLKGDSRLGLAKQAGLNPYNKFTSYICLGTQTEVRSIQGKIQKALQKNGINAQVRIGKDAKAKNLSPDKRDWYYINIEPANEDGKVEARNFTLAQMLDKLEESVKIQVLLAGDSDNDFSTFTTSVSKDITERIESLVAVAVGNSDEGFLGKLKKATEVFKKRRRLNAIRVLPDTPNHFIVLPREPLLYGIIQADINGLTIENLFKQVSSN